jgi:outer membrane murein-binding lipoprotein Lpp
MLRIGRYGAGGLVLRAIVLGVCLLAGCVRSATPVAMVVTSHLGDASTAG